LQAIRHQTAGHRALSSLSALPGYPGTVASVVLDAFIEHDDNLHDFFTTVKRELRYFEKIK
jgi:hypothetical protein